MIIDQPIKQNDVVCIKLSNGDEIIARYFDGNDKYINISKPLLMVLTQDNTGRPAIQMAPLWMMGPEQSGKFKINMPQIICIALASKDATLGYTKNTSSLAIPGGIG
jgi:hypothetical protein